MTLQCSKQEIELAEKWLGFSLKSFEFIQTVRSLEEAQVILLDVQKKIRANWKRVALELHPDRTGNDEEKTKIFKALSNVVDEVERQKVTVRESVKDRYGGRGRGRSLGKITIRMNIRKD
jgi:uncharacterized protein YeeX (DUF496 family)